MSEIIRGDIIETRDSSVLFAIWSDPDNTVWIPHKAISQPEWYRLEEEDDVELEVRSWWYNQNEELFADGD